MAKGKTKAAGGSEAKKRGAAGKAEATVRKTGAAGVRRDKTAGDPGGGKAAKSQGDGRTAGSRGGGKAAGSKTKPTRGGKAGHASTETAEVRIKEAARKLFTQYGFAAVRTRDIAKEAGINLALLNYYFRSKQKLFDLVMMENFRKFLTGMTVSFQDPSLSMENRLERIVTSYVDFLNEFPDLPLFILNEIKGNPSKIAEQIREEVGPARSQFFKELQEAKKAGKIELEPFHFVANLVGLTVFPFVSRPLLQRVTGASDEQFLQLMEDRKKLVPAWIKMMMLMKMPAGTVSKK